MDQEDREFMRQKVQDGMAWSLEATGSFHSIIEDALTQEFATSEEIEWAKENLDWKVVIIG